MTMKTTMRMRKLSKDNIFEIGCRVCGYKGDAKNFVKAIDVWFEKTNQTRSKIVTLQCPSCKAAESFETVIW